MVGNFVLRLRVSGAVNHNFRPLLSDDENFEYGGYPNWSALFNCYTLKQYISCVSDVNSIRRPITSGIARDVRFSTILSQISDVVQSDVALYSQVH